MCSKAHGLADVIAARLRDAGEIERARVFPYTPPTEFESGASRMSSLCHTALSTGDSVPAILGFNVIALELLDYGAIPAAEVDFDCVVALFNTRLSDEYSEPHLMLSSLPSQQILLAA